MCFGGPLYWTLSGPETCNSGSPESAAKIVAMNICCCRRAIHTALPLPHMKHLLIKVFWWKAFYHFSS